MHEWLPYWYAGLLGTSSARAFVETCEHDDHGIPRDFAGDVSAWPESWRARFGSPDELREFVSKRSSQAEQALRQMKVQPVTTMVSSQFAASASAFRTPFVQHLGTLKLAMPRAVRIAIVGTRKISHEDSKRVRGWLASWFRATPVVVVSGGAYGIDSIAHEAALDGGLTTWSVQAGGLATLSPSGNSPLFRRIVESGGAMISERPPHITPRKHDFLARNRIIAALADAVVVVRAPHRSGALNTAREAKRMGTPVYAVPGSPGEPSIDGSNGLLNDYASVLGSAADWQEMVGRCEAAKAAKLPLGFAQAHPDSRGTSLVKNTSMRATATDASSPQPRLRTQASPRPPSTPTTPAEQALRELLADGTRHFDVLTRAWREDTYGSLSSVLLQGELRGAVARLPGNQYRWC